VAAEAVGLGACPLSRTCNGAARVAQVFGLADHVFPVAALALGWPAEAPATTPRLRAEAHNASSSRRGQFGSNTHLTPVSFAEMARQTRLRQSRNSAKCLGALLQSAGLG